jgi:cytochrome c biogenesis protein
VWALQQGPNVYLVGRSNRAKVMFEQELDAVIDSVPELPPAAAAAAAAAAPVSAAVQQ